MPCVLKGGLVEEHGLVDIIKSKETNNRVKLMATCGLSYLFKASALEKGILGTMIRLMLKHLKMEKNANITPMVLYAILCLSECKGFN